MGRKKKQNLISYFGVVQHIRYTVYAMIYDVLWVPLQGHSVNSIKSTVPACQGHSQLLW